MPIKDLVNIIWLCLLVFATAAYWFYNPSLLSELVDIIGNAVSGGLVLFSDLTANFVLLLISLLALRFFMFLIAEVVKKQMPKAIGNLAGCLISAVFIFLFNSWVHVTLSAYYVLSILLFLFGLYEVSKGICNGLFRENQTNILKGDWKTLLLGVRIMLLSVIFTESDFLVFRDFVYLIPGLISMPLIEGEFIPDFSAFMLIVLFVYILTAVPSRLIFVKCKRCKMVFLEIGVPESSWDSEHTSKHRHCPRCGAACF